MSPSAVQSVTATRVSRLMAFATQQQYDVTIYPANYVDYLDYLSGRDEWYVWWSRDGSSWVFAGSGHLPTPLKLSVFPGHIRVMLANDTDPRLIEVAFNGAVGQYTADFRALTLTAGFTPPPPVHGSYSILVYPTEFEKYSAIGREWDLLWSPDGSNFQPVTHGLLPEPLRASVDAGWLQLQLAGVSDPRFIVFQFPGGNVTYTVNFRQISFGVGTSAPAPLLGPFATLAALTAEDARLQAEISTGFLSQAAYIDWYKGVYTPEFKRLTATTPPGPNPPPSPGPKPPPSPGGSKKMPAWVPYAIGAVVVGGGLGLLFFQKPGGPRTRRLSERDNRDVRAKLYRGSQNVTRKDYYGDGGF